MIASMPLVARGVSDAAAAVLEEVLHGILESIFRLVEAADYCTFHRFDGGQVSRILSFDGDQVSPIDPDTSFTDGIVAYVASLPDDSNAAYYLTAGDAQEDPRYGGSFVEDIHCELAYRLTTSKGTCDYSGNTVTCTIGTVAPAEEITLQVQFTASVPNSIANTG